MTDEAADDSAGYLRMLLINLPRRLTHLRGPRGMTQQAGIPTAERIGVRLFPLTTLSPSLDPTIEPQTNHHHQSRHLDLQ